MALNEVNLGPGSRIRYINLTSAVSCKSAAHRKSAACCNCGALCNFAAPAYPAALCNSGALCNGAVPGYAATLGAAPAAAPSQSPPQISAAAKGKGRAVAKPRAMSRARMPLFLPDEDDPLATWEDEFQASAHLTWEDEIYFPVRRQSPPDVAMTSAESGSDVRLNADAVPAPLDVVMTSAESGSDVGLNADAAPGSPDVAMPSAPSFEDDEVDYEDDQASLAVGSDDEFHIFEGSDDEGEELDGTDELWLGLPEALEPAEQLKVDQEARDRSGEWLCHPDLVRKRLDFVVDGKTQTNDHLAASVGQKHGWRGYVVLERPINFSNRNAAASGFKAKVGFPHKNVKIWAGNARPERSGYIGAAPERTRIESAATSMKTGTWCVVIIGEDCSGDLDSIGAFARIMPDAEHKFGSDAVKVEFAGRIMDENPTYGFFPICSLCRSDNIDTPELMDIGGGKGWFPSYRRK
ncbi:hypothetical protein DFH09DRAFT_1098597 [Mycena vulgaris]|nr:hypothetical protein DFH09DRAFT_1098597 [Mycena vulgaris]